MRILFVLHRFVPRSLGGTEVTVYRVARELGRRHEVHVAFPAPAPPQGNEAFPYEGFQVHPLPPSPASRLSKLLQPVPRHRAWAQRSIEVLDRIQPEVIHGYQLQGVCPELMTEAHHRGIRTLFTLQDFWYLCTRSHLTRADSSSCEGPTSEFRNCERCRQETGFEQLGLPPRALFPFASVFPLRAGLQQRAESFIQMLNQADALIAPSNFLMEKYIAYGVHRDRFHPLRDSVEQRPLAGFKRSSSDHVRFGFIGALLPHKGVLTLLEATRRGGFDLTFHGPFHPDSIRFHRQVQRLAGPTVRFAGSFNHLADPLSRTDCIVLPSECHENCPAAILQGHATGTPSIASRMGGIPELVEEGRNGLLFRAGDAADLQRCMQRVTDRNYLDQLARGTSRPDTMEEHVRKLESLYNPRP